MSAEPGDCQGAVRWRMQGQGKGRGRGSRRWSYSRWWQTWTLSLVCWSDDMGSLVTTIFASMVTLLLWSHIHCHQWRQPSIGSDCRFSLRHQLRIALQWWPATKYCQLRVVQRPRGGSTVGLLSWGSDVSDYDVCPQTSVATMLLLTAGQNTLSQLVWPSLYYLRTISITNHVVTTLSWLPVTTCSPWNVIEHNDGSGELTLADTDTEAVSVCYEAVVGVAATEQLQTLEQQPTHWPA